MLVLHYFPDTASLAVRITLAELAIPHRCALIDRDGGALASPGYRALHPLGKIPAMETPDGPMFETAAMLLWLSDTRAPGRLAPAADAPDRAAFLTWFFFTSTNIHQTLLELFYPDRVAGADVVSPVLAYAHDRMQTFLTALEKAAAARPDWLAPDRPTLLGIYIAMLMRWLGSMPTGHPAHFGSADFPALHRVLQFMDTHPAAVVVATDEALGPTPFSDPAK